MIRTRLYLTSLLLLLVFSCDNEEVAPRTFPKFSVTMVQDISASGAEFSAQMKDYGSEEILEFGFAYGQSRNPRTGNSDYVSAIGVPSENFTLTTNYGLIKGRSYFVAAFIRTSNGFVYSESTQFFSQGSDGFIFEKVDIKEPVYYNDTIIISGKNLSIQSKNYEAYVNGTFAIMTGTSKEGFKIIIPDNIKIERVDDQFVNLTVNLKIDEKDFSLKKEVKFKEPEFIKNPIQEVLYDEEVVIRGDFLTTEQLSLEIRNSSGASTPIPIKQQSDELIKFSARLNNFNYKGELVVRIRGKEYLIEDLFIMKGSELKMGQKLRGNSRDNFGLEGTNFIPNNEKNLLKTDYETIEADAIFSSTNRLSVNFKGTNFTRNVKVFVNNFEKESTNFAEIEFTDSFLRWFRTPNELRDFRTIKESGVTVDGFGYFFLERNVYKVYPDIRKIEIIASAPPDVFSLAGGFSYAASNGKIYLGSLDNSSSQNSFWEFDPITYTFKKLADNPSSANKPKLVYATISHLYFEGGYKFGPTGYQWDDGVFKYSFQTDTWSKLERKFPNDGYTKLFKTFSFKGEIYSIIQDTKTLLTRVNRFNPISETWEFYHNIGLFDNITEANEYFVIGDLVYTFQDQTISAFNMTSRTAKKWQNEPSFHAFSFHYSFQSGSKIYAVNNYFLYEFDPNYFDK